MDWVQQQQQGSQAGAAALTRPALDSQLSSCSIDTHMRAVYGTSCRLLTQTTAPPAPRTATQRSARLRPS